MANNNTFGNLNRYTRHLERKMGKRSFTNTRNNFNKMLTRNKSRSRKTRRSRKH